MLQKKQIKADVLVVGAGLAGMTAAIWAARQGCRVIIASSSIIGSGSSFYPGTWGLGLVGPENPADCEDLLNTIIEVGEGMADLKLAACLIQGIDDAIVFLKALGVRLKEAVHKDEREFIPCFDHKKRNWHGIMKESAKAALQRELDSLGVEKLTHTTVTDIFIKDGRVSGAAAVKKQDNEDVLITIGCSSIIIASGGLGGLFKYRLNTPDVMGMGQYLALKAGASLINLEFMQMMPGFIKPAPKTIFNEKVFRYSEFYNARTGESIFEDISLQELKNILEIRSGHGPFTCRLGCEKVDIRLYQEFIKNESGVLLRYSRELKDNQPEFVKIYFDWLKEEKGINLDDPVHIGIFAHASNGGIYIDTKAETGVKGLFACGEATGGMHGADRLGGLSTANALVYGKIAGISAAEYGSLINPEIPEENPVLSCIPQADALLEKIRSINYHSAMIVRHKAQLNWALEQIAEIKNEAENSRQALEHNMAAGRQYQRMRRLEAAIVLSEAMLSAMLLRAESRGSHYREDYTTKNNELAKPVICKLRDGKTVLSFME